MPWRDIGNDDNVYIAAWIYSKTWLFLLRFCVLGKLRFFILFNYANKLSFSNSNFVLISLRSINIKRLTEKAAHSWYFQSFNSKIYWILIKLCCEITCAVCSGYWFSFSLLFTMILNKLITGSFINFNSQCAVRTEHFSYIIWLLVAFMRLRVPQSNSKQ